MASNLTEPTPQFLPFFELSSDIMCILDDQGCFRQMNSAFLAHLGYSTDALQGSALADLTHPDDREGHQNAIAQTLTQGAHRRFRYRYRHQSGDYHWLSWNISAVDIASNQTKQLYCVARDVTHQVVTDRQHQARTNEKYSDLQRLERQNRHSAQQAQKEASMYLETVCNMQIGIYIWQLEDADGQSDLILIATNPAAQEFTGVDATSMIGKSICEVFPALQETDIPAIYANVARTGQPHDLGEVVYGDEQVTTGVFDVKAFPLSHQCVGVAFENITERKRDEIAHREKEEQLRIIFNQAGVGMGRLSVEGKWIQVNQRLCELLEYSQSELLGRHFSKVSEAADTEQTQKIYQSLFAGEQEQNTFEKRFVTRSGNIIWASVTASAVRDLSGQLLYLIVTVQDITARKQASLTLQNQKNDLMTVNLMLTEALSQLEERNQELDQFAYVTSHDLRAPLRAIANLATWIEEDIADTLPEENKKQFQLLKNRVQRMEGLINGLLEYSRVARTHQSHEQVDVYQLVSDIVDSLSPPEGFTVELTSDLPVLESKKVPLIQVFSNLINNAIKHHHRPDGHIRVSVREIDDFYEFTVADDGPGIDAAYHEKIFVIFQTLKARDTFESTGIGLSLVKKIVTSEGGSVFLESSPGEGATFRITWPKAPNQGLKFT